MHAEFNHVQFAIDAALAQGENLAALDSFFDRVLGWERLDAGDRKVLLFIGPSRSQYLVLNVEDVPATFNAEDHVGLYVSDANQYAKLRDAAYAYQRNDDRLTITNFEPETTNGVTAGGIRINYLMPFSIEIALIQYADDEPRHLFRRLWDR
jgi:hypothetical protein